MSWKVLATYENSIDLGIAIGIFLLFLLFRKIFAKYVFSLLIKLSTKARTNFFSQIFYAFEKPIQWLFIIIGIYTSVRYFPLFNHADPLFLKVIRSAIIVVISWGIFNLTSASSVLFAKLNDKYNFEIDSIIIPFLSKGLRVIVVVISISVIAQEFDYDVNGFIAGLGIGGLAISLAAKDALANLVGGFVIITEKPFSTGDWIMTPSVEGTVEDITFRSTMVRSAADALVTVPNSILANESITNWSKMEKREVSFYLKVAQDTSKDKLENVVKKIHEFIIHHADVHPDVIHVRFTQYQENGYEIFCYFFTKTTVMREFLKVKEEVNFGIMEILENEGVLLAIPSRRLYVGKETAGLLKVNSLEGSNF
jgi:MscS family membrane protein